MKTPYNKPALITVQLRSNKLLALSFDKNDTGSDGSLFIKEDVSNHSSSSSPSYNVWDDDWRK